MTRLLSFVVAIGIVLSLATVASASPAVTDSLVSVGSPATVTPNNHQNEPAVAVDANNPNFLVAGSNDYIDMQPCPKTVATQKAVCDDFTAGIGVSGVYFSFDRGRTWTQPTYTGWQARNCTGDTDCPGSFGPIGRIPWYYESGLVDDGDPAVAVGPRLVNGQFSWANGSRVYYANLTANFPGTATFKGAEAVAVSRLDNPTPTSVLDKSSWMPPVLVSGSQSNTAFDDKEQIWADNASSSAFFGNVYTCFVDFRSNGHHNPGNVPAPLFIGTSSDGGSSWRLNQITSASTDAHGVNLFGYSGCTVRTDSHGVVSVFAEMFQDPALTGFPTHGAQVILQSFDGGAHFTKPRALFSITDPCFFTDPLSGRCVMDGYTGARTDLASSPSVDIANGAPTGLGATNLMLDGWADASNGLNHEDARVAWSSDGGASWSAPSSVSLPGDRPIYAAPAISPAGDQAYLVYEGFRTPWVGADTSTPRTYRGVFLSAPVGASGPGAWSTEFTSPIGDMRSSYPGHHLDQERVGDYVYAAATRTYGVGLYIDIRNAADCPAIDAWRAASLAAGKDVIPAPFPTTDCPSTWGNMDVRAVTTG